VFVVLFVVGAVSSTFSEYIGLKPGWIITRVWTTLTCGFFHRTAQIVELLINIIVIVFITPIIDPIWGYWEILRFIFGVNFICAVGTAIFRVLLYYITDETQLLFNSVEGFFGASTALIVAMKQINPDKEWKVNTMFNTISFRAKHLPAIFLLLGIILFFISYSATIEFSLIGLTVSWIYLRYYQYHDGSYGDQSNQFRFSTLFPDAMEPLFVFLSRFCICCGGKKKTSTTILENVEVKQTKDADRQRKLALKVLDDKFQNMKELPQPTKLEVESIYQPETLQT
jgi:hypothetical protein